MDYSRFSILPIPATIRRRLPRLYSSHRVISDSDSSGVVRHGLASSSDPQLSYQFSDLGIVDPQRPSTGNDSLDSLDYSSAGSNSPPGEEGILPAKYETESGLRWNRVVPAFNLLRNAGYEAQQPRSDGRLARSLYVSALMYLLDALPQDLTTEEKIMLQHRLPEPVKASIRADSQSTTPQSDTQAHPRIVPCNRSYLHRVLASAILQIFLLIRFILPYLKVLLSHVYQYERSHRITERIVATTLDAADGVSRKSVDLSSAVFKFNEGRLGVAVGSLISWWVEGIAGGVYEGVGDGMMELGLLKPQFELDRLAFQIDRR